MKIATQEEGLISRKHYHMATRSSSVNFSRATFTFLHLQLSVCILPGNTRIISIMPTVVVMDVSLSMTRPVSIEGSEEYQRKHLAAHGLTMLFEHMATNYKLEFTALVVFSSLWELMVPFTRDYNTLQEALSNMDDYDKTCLESALVGVCNIVQQEWGGAIPCQVMINSFHCSKLKTLTTEVLRFFSGCDTACTVIPTNYIIH
nr:integrator complex subunit 14-like [Manis javanica]